MKKLFLLKILLFGLGIPLTSQALTIWPDYVACRDQVRKSYPEECNEDDYGASYRAYCGYIAWDESDSFKLIIDRQEFHLHPAGLQFSDDLVARLTVAAGAQVKTKICVMSPIDYEEPDNIIFINNIENFKPTPHAKN